MERSMLAAHRWRLIFFASAGAVAVYVLRRVLLALGMQLLAASILMLLAMPLCRRLERRLPGGLAAAVSLVMLGAWAALVLMIAIPPMMRQFRQLTALVPRLLEGMQGMLQQIVLWLEGRGLDVAPMKDGLLSQLTDAAGRLVSRGMGIISGVAGSISQVLLSPLLAFYLLRDRRRIASGLTLLLPVHWRARGVRAAREMKRETAAYLRGQLMLSISVGGMTALGLALTGTPGWLLLGILMGMLELVPYIGPVIAGAPAVLLALQGGWAPALWTLGVIVVIQEVEGAVLSPRLLGGATALHPMMVLLLVSGGGMIAGTVGMVGVIPLTVSIRGAIRGWRQ